MTFPLTNEFSPSAVPPVFVPSIHVDWKGAYCDHCYCKRTDSTSRVNLHRESEDGDRDMCCMCGTRSLRRVSPETSPDLDVEKGQGQ